MQGVETVAHIGLLDRTVPALLSNSRYPCTALELDGDHSSLSQPLGFHKISNKSLYALCRYHLILLQSRCIRRVTKDTPMLNPKP